MRNGRFILFSSIFTILFMSLFIGQQSSAAETIPATTQNSPTETNAGISFNVNAVGKDINPYLLGTNLPAWLGTARTQNNTFINRTKALHTPILRLPGGSWSNGYNWLACENNDSSKCWSAGWGLNPTAFIDFLQATGSDAMFTINMNGTSKEAAALVAFFNGSVTDNRVIGVDVNGYDWGTVSKWAQLRRDHGNPEPINIKYYEIGNEIYGGKPGQGKDCLDWGWEDVWTCDGNEYVNGLGNHEGFITFRNAMRTVDSSIKVGAVGVTYGNSPDWWLNYTNWGNEVIAAAGSQMDFYIIHQYAFGEPASYQEVLAQPQGTWQAIKADINTSFDQHANGRRVPIAVTEYNLFAFEGQDTNEWMSQAVNGLFLADTIGQMMQNEFDIANQWDISHGDWSQGIPSRYGLMHSDDYTRSPQYYVFPLWAKFGQEMLPITSSYNAATQLSVYAGRIDASTVSVLAINKTGNPIATTIQVDGTSQISSGLADVVKASSLSSQSVTFNNVSNPNDDLSNAPATSLSNLTNPLAYTFEPYSITLLRLSIDETPPQLSVANKTVTEGNNGTANANFTVSLSSASSDTVTVNYATADDTATAGSDYTSANGSLTFNPGDTSKTIQVPIVGDVVDEGSSERFRLNLSNASVDIADSQADGIIEDDDTAQLSIANGPSVVEGNSGTVPAVFNVSLSTPAAFQVTVNYASVVSTENGPATPGIDYESVSGSLTFTPGQTSKTITVMINGDTKFEGNEKFNVVLSNANPVAINVSSSTGRILDDDPASDFVFLPLVSRN